MAIENKKIVFYDGDCGFCNRSVQFILKKNKPKTPLYFCTLQSDFCKKLFEKHLHPTPKLSSIVFYDSGKFYFKSTAVLKISAYLDNMNYLKLAYIFPAFLRNTVYDLVAKNRHRINSNHTCTLPSETEKNRFIG
jgi:predicted DCC family thiol-disulfide oxidoreductase YuxK